MMEKRPNLRAAVVGALVAVAIVFCATVALAEGTKEGPELKKIKIALSPYQDVASIIVAQQRGFFREEGLEVDLIPAAWNDAVEMLGGGAVDFSNVGDGNVIQKLGKMKNLTFSNLLYLWEANVLIGQKGKGFKTFEDFKNQGMSDYNAAKACCAQLSGKAVIVASGSQNEEFLRAVAKFGGVDYDKEVKPYVIDMETQDGLPALIRGEGDLYKPGIPQIQKLTELGYPIVVHQANTPLPGGAAYAGFATTQEYARDNFDTVVKLQAVIFRTLKWIDENQMAGFGIICDYLNERTAAGMTPEDLQKKYWNVIEFFPLPEESYKLTMLPEGKRYWKDRWEYAFQRHVEIGNIPAVPDNWEEFVLWPKVFTAYLKQYEPQLWNKLPK